MPRKADWVAVSREDEPATFVTIDASDPMTLVPPDLDMFTDKVCEHILVNFGDCYTICKGACSTKF